MAFLLHQLLVETAGRHPDREAVRFDRQGMTYAELDRATNRLARALQSAGVRRGDRVGIYVHKSPASLLAVFGILKAGGVYVPFDPNAPADRLAYIARNCGLRVLVTAPGKLDGVRQILGGAELDSVVLAEAGEVEGAGLPSGPATFHGAALFDWEAVLGMDAGPLPPTGAIDADLAYILYTSGSTGDPKGVMIAHRTIFTFIDWCSETFEIGPEDRVTSHAPLHFDLSTFDIFVTLKAGAAICLIPEKLSIFPINLVRFLQDEGITTTYMVPSIYSLMVNFGKLEGFDLSRLQRILFAGEVFPIKYLRKLAEAIPGAAYYNLYGPTETNVCTYYRVQPEDLAPDRVEPVPIGRACENMEVFALDDEGRRVTEPGQEGELWARGGCVALGYWGDPEKTARVFVRNPIEPNFDEPAYRTGDIVTLADDRLNWRFVGRRDHMIKSRGYRIELGEVEAALYAHAGVKEAAVVAVPDELIGSRLKAYVVQAEAVQLSAADLKAFCARKLPSYMVPELFEFREGLPKTSTGKVNRREL